MNKNFLYFVLTIIFFLFSFTTIVNGQTVTVYEEPDFEIFSTYNSSMGGLSVTNIFNPFSFISNASLTPLRNYPGLLYISGFQGVLPGSYMDKLYLFYNYDELETAISNQDENYLRSFQGVSSKYGYSGPIQMMFISTYFCAGFFTSSVLTMSYDELGVPPALNFRIDKDLMLTFSLSYPFQFSDDIILSIGGRFKYIQRDSFSKKLTGDEFIGLVDYKDEPLIDKTFKNITGGYSRENAIGIDLSVTFMYKFLITAITFNDASIPIDGIMGTKFSRKEYSFDGTDDHLLPSSSATYIIPSTLNFSCALYFEKVMEDDFIKDFYFGIDIVDIFASDFTADNINIGVHATFFKILQLMMGTNIKSFTIGLSINVLFFDLSFSYGVNFDRSKRETDTLNGMLLVYF